MALKFGLWDKLWAQQYFAMISCRTAFGAAIAGYKVPRGLFWSRKLHCEQQFMAQNTVHSYGPSARASTRILSPSFGALVFDQKPII